MAYTPEQIKIISDTIAESKSTGGVDYNWSDRIVRRSRDQAFAVFGGLAREFFVTQRGNDPIGPQLLIDFDDQLAYEYVPVIINGRCLEESPDEGRSGMLYLMRCLARRGVVRENPEWMCTFLQTGTLWESELGIPDAEISDKIVEEIEAGETPITGFNSQERYK